MSTMKNQLENNEFTDSKVPTFNEAAMLLGVLASEAEVWTVRGVSEETRRQSKIAALITGLSIGEFVDGALLTAVQMGVEGVSTVSKGKNGGKNGKIWTIRGIRPETRRLSRIAALQLGWTVGDFIDRALLSATERLQTENPHFLKQTA